MRKEIDKIYLSGSLSKYSFRERLIIRAAGWAFFQLIKLIGKTIRYEVEGLENLDGIEKASKLPIYAYWHDRIFAGTYFFRGRGIVAMTSQSLDGEYTARFIQRLGFGAIRGSSTRGGVGALVEMIRVMRAGRAAAFAVDGPKGPPYIAKTGAVLLAKKTGNPLLPFVVEARNYWTVKSWDRLQIPKPFTRARVIIDEPIYVIPEASDKEITDKLAALQRSLDVLNIKGEKWRVHTGSLRSEK